VYINGLGHGRRPDYGYYYEAIEAMSFAPTVEKVLIIGFGAGSITEAILKMRDVRNITLVELSHALIKNLTRLSLFEEMLSDPRINLIIDDGRRFLLRSEDQFDLILIDPLRSTTAYSNNLYSHQFFELINRHLASGGVFMVWMNEHRVMPKTVLSVFNHVRKYTSFCLASNMPFIRNKKRQETLLLSFSPRERESILKIDAGSYLGDQVFVENLTSGYPINQDWKPICEYYLGLRVKEKYFY
jgi:spermidine synthase